jgi:hypothetical protein
MDPLGRHDQKQFAAFALPTVVSGNFFPGHSLFATEFRQETTRLYLA